MFVSFFHTTASLQSAVNTAHATVPKYRELKQPNRDKWNIVDVYEKEKKINIVYFLSIILCLGVYGSSLRQQESAKFSISSMFESAVPAAIHPLIAAGSYRCESIKRFFGLTYDQMQEKNLTLYENLNIDFVTNSGNVKLNVTATGLLDRLLDNTKNTVVLTHGFMESSDGIMAKALTSELLKIKGMDILVLDGRKFISYEYFRSTTYVRFIGEKLGSLLSEIIKKGQDANNVIIIGHSLGAHIAGIAGKRIQQLTGKAIGRIIALDPAGPCFINIRRDSRLDRNDAVHVDVIHTNGGILGLKEPVGHKDFYPNGGSSQPGCFLSTCDHSRAWELFAESLTFPQHFIARRCSNWTMFREGHCLKNEFAYIGINSTKGNHGSYFLLTNSVTPFGFGSDSTG